MWRKRINCWNSDWAIKIYYFAYNDSFSNQGYISRGSESLEQLNCPGSTIELDNMETAEFEESTEVEEVQDDLSQRSCLFKLYDRFKLFCITAEFWVRVLLYIILILVSANIVYLFEELLIQLIKDNLIIISDFVLDHFEEDSLPNTLAQWFTIMPLSLLCGVLSLLLRIRILCTLLVISIWEMIGAFLFP